jgi:hypothetical protein
MLVLIHIYPLNGAKTTQITDGVFVTKFVFEWLAKNQGFLDLTFY